MLQPAVSCQPAFLPAQPRAAAGGAAVGSAATGTTAPLSSMSLEAYCQVQSLLTGGHPTVQPLQALQHGAIRTQDLKQVASEHMVSNLHHGSYCAPRLHAQPQHWICYAMSQGVMHAGAVPSRARRRVEDEAGQCGSLLRAHMQEISSAAATVEPLCAGCDASTTCCVYWRRTCSTRWSACSCATCSDCPAARPDSRWAIHMRLMRV